LSREARFIATLVKVDGDVVVERPGERPPGYVLSVACDADVLVGLRGLVEGKKELERIDRAVKKVEKDLVSLEKRLADPKFIDKAPPEVVVQVREQRAALERQRARLVEERGLADEL
jgi:valyl-tRNA synthetase